MNLLNVTLTASALRFNRYMVECEYLIGGNLMGAGTSFNRYMVECECSTENVRKDFR